MDGFMQDVQKVVVESGKVFETLPDYDFGEYTFIFDLLPKNNGDGMEHLNSTCITGRAGKLTKELMKGELGVTSHEFFHCWNVERIRPKSLEPFNFTKSNMSSELWVAEGFTNYYGELILARAGLMQKDDFLEGLSFYVNGFNNNPGGKFRTPIQSSRMAIFTDAGTAIDKTNFGNIFYSYYLYGESLAAILDLTLRKDHNRTLDDFMKRLWQKHGKTRIPYTVPDLQSALEAITNPTFAKQFFADYVYSVKREPLNDLFGHFGVNVINPNAGKASLGNLTLKIDSTGEIMNVIQQGSPLYQAGLENGDIILQLDDKDVKTIANVNAILATKKPGDVIPIKFKSRGHEISTMITAMEVKGTSLQIDTNANAAKKAALVKWLGE